MYAIDTLPDHDADSRFLAVTSMILIKPEKYSDGERIIDGRKEITQVSNQFEKSIMQFPNLTLSLVNQSFQEPVGQARFEFPSLGFGLSMNRQDSRDLR